MSLNIKSQRAVALIRELAARTTAIRSSCTVPLGISSICINDVHRWYAP